MTYTVVIPLVWSSAFSVGEKTTMEMIAGCLIQVNIHMTVAPAAPVVHPSLTPKIIPPHACCSGRSGGTGSPEETVVVRQRQTEGAEALLIGGGSEVRGLRRAYRGMNRL